MTDDLESKRKNIINKIDLVTILTYKNAPELIDQINNLKNFVEKIEIKSNSDYDKENKKQKCKYHNRCFCKFKDNCNKFHSEHICKDYLEKEKCEKMGCLYRHPKDCFIGVKKKKDAIEKVFANTFTESLRNLLLLNLKLPFPVTNVVSKLHAKQLLMDILKPFRS